MAETKGEGHPLKIVGGLHRVLALRKLVAVAAAAAAAAVVVVVCLSLISVSQLDIIL